MIRLAGIGVAVVVAAFFALAELTMISAGRWRLRHWVVETMRSPAWLAEEPLERPYRLLSPIRFGYVLAVTVAAVLTPSALAAGDPRSPLALAAWTVVILVPALYLGVEILPRATAAARADRLFPAIAWVLRACAWLFRPILASAEWLTGKLLQAVGEGVERSGRLSRRKLEGLLAESERVGIVEPGEREIITGVFDFGRTPVREVMQPAGAIVSAPIHSTAGELTALMRQTGYSRIPLRGAAPDRIVGMVHVFDVFKVPADHRPPAHPVVTTAPERPCDELLLEMKQRRCHLAIVVEGRRTLGMVTLEDLVEELVGEIRDEHDPGAARGTSDDARG
ncbi:MAG TPA: CNNM domain-containing protein [Gemmatimonadota bacterium]|nr:CNNM domain-containing protein [Gemmatimonadota bacterium]